MVTNAVREVRHNSTSSVPTRKQAKIWPLTIQKGCRVYLLKVGITMDLLHKELQRKKKALERAKQEAALDDGNNDNNNNKKTSGGGSSKFLRVGDLRRVEEEQEEEERRKQKEKQREEQVRFSKQQRKRRLVKTGEQEPDNSEDPNKATKKKKKKKKRRRIEGESGNDTASNQNKANENLQDKQDGRTSQMTSTASSKQAEGDMILKFRQMVSLWLLKC